jgi:hypothetical protein
VTAAEQCERSGGRRASLETRTTAYAVCWVLLGSGDTLIVHSTRRRRGRRGPPEFEHTREIVPQRAVRSLRYME